MKIDKPKILANKIVVNDLYNLFLKQDEQPIVGVLLSERDFTGLDFERIEISSSVFFKCKMVECDFSNGSFVDVRFENCDFSNSRFIKSYFVRCEFYNCKGVGSNFRDSTWKHVLIDNSVLHYTNFDSSYFETVSMHECNFRDTSFSSIKHKRWEIKENHFDHVSFFRTNLKGMDFSENELLDMIVSNELTEIKGAKFAPIQVLEIAKLLDIIIV